MNSLDAIVVHYVQQQKKPQRSRIFVFILPIEYAYPAYKGGRDTRTAAIGHTWSIWNRKTARGRNWIRNTNSNHKIVQVNGSISSRNDQEQFSLIIYLFIIHYYHLNLLLWNFISKVMKFRCCSPQLRYFENKMLLCER